MLSPLHIREVTILLFVVSWIGLGHVYSLLQNKEWRSCRNCFTSVSANSRSLSPPAVSSPIRFIDSSKDVSHLLRVSREYPPEGLGNQAWLWPLSMGTPANAFGTGRLKYPSYRYRSLPTDSSGIKHWLLCFFFRTIDSSREILFNQNMRFNNAFRPWQP